MNENQKNFKFNIGETIYYSNGFEQISEEYTQLDDSHFFGKGIIKRQIGGITYFQYKIEDMKNSEIFFITECYCFRSKKEMFKIFDKWCKKMKNNFNKG